MRSRPGSWTQLLRKPLERWRQRPFGRLVGHFLQKLVRGGRDDSSEVDLGAGALLGILAAPGAFASFLMMEKYSTLLDSPYFRNRKVDYYASSVNDKYLFLCLAMAVAGIVTVLKWDRILPDQQDYINLAPLPVSSRRILLANALAILFAVIVVAVAMNLVPTIMFPAFVTAAAGSTLAGFAAFIAAHGATVLLATVFSIASVFAVLGTFSAILPRQAFRTVSPWLRGTLVLALLPLIPAGFLGPPAVRWLPTVWFLGLYQAAQHRATALQSEVAPYALWGCCGVLLVCVVTYELSYRRRFAAVLEGGPKPSMQPLLGLIIRLLDLFAPRNAAFGRAAHRFVVRAMLRGETHRLTIAIALGLGWMSGSALGAAYLLILGLRIAFDLPAAVRANWIFRVTLDPQHNQTAGVARRAVLGFLTPIVLVPAFAAGWWQSGPLTAIVDSAYLLALSLIWIEILLAGYRKMPLTCPMPGFKENFLALILLQFVGLLVFTLGGAAIKGWMWAAPWRFALLPAGMWASWHWNRRRLAGARAAGELEEGLLFDNSVASVVTRLDLTG